ncbi:DASH family cryptochrome [Marinomonas sp. IMCC 4694]|uniref:DASH family cryptochrome n=1 Tax=Marinomonas sp. IMCC 4694 TaxID=2605432 RepID=UPI0011E73787|nr:DASH family cryptochrome [Marinomonas sp. IMCC 4694]TYL46593.1 DASH family cryptochrome [Marinomonas sp. IMCC 4694]
MKIGVIWFGEDLRCADQGILWRAAQEVDHVVCLYCDEPHNQRPSRYTTQGMSDNRRRFLQQGLDDLAAQLKNLGQTLYVSALDAVTSLTLLLNEVPISHLYRNHHGGWDEQQALKRIATAFPDVRLHIDHGLSLFKPSQLPFDPEQLPVSFSKFRRLVENIDLATLLPAIPSLPPEPVFAIQQVPPWPPTSLNRRLDENSPFTGGEQAAIDQLSDYFSTNLPQHYKETRNELDGWENSTKFSPWLAQGSVSPRQIKASLDVYEGDHGANDSTYWIYFELLWREYFHWYATRYGKQLFLAGGLSGKPAQGSYYAERFRKWSQGNTPYPIVNACMKQLNATGFMSNRGRQIVASCLIYELGIDWRYGAAYFEEQLVDYDVGSNWGNWQYIAGVGADPRGGRHFNLKKQTEQYDPKQRFINKWQGQDFDSQLDSVDAADWPIYPTP